MASTLIGTVLGGLLAILGGYLVGLKQRGWQKEQALFERDLAKSQAQFERELSITKALDGSLVEAERRILGRGTPEGEKRLGNGTSGVGGGMGACFTAPNKSQRQRPIRIGGHDAH